MTSTSSRPLLLWDIDHTLLSLPGAGKTWYVSALKSFGVDLHTHPDYSGRTERAITIDALTTHGIEPSEANIRRLWDELINLSAITRRSFAQLGHVRDGAADVLATAAQSGAVQTLVTGNLPEISRDKVMAFDLHEHLDLEIGGYGSLSVDRRDLIPHAIAAAEAKADCRFAADQVVVIGDTPNDIAAAHDNGIRIVAVATGHFSTHELSTAGADLVLPDLADQAATNTALLKYRA